MKNRKVVTAIISIIGIVLIISALVSATYALFSSDAYGSNPNNYTTGTLVIEAQSKSENISLTSALPMTDEEGAKSVPYVFTIKNTGNLDYKFDVKLLSTSSNSFSSQYIKVQVDDGNIKTFNEYAGGVIKSNVILSAGETADISLRIWLSNNIPNTELGKSFESKIVTNGQAVYATSFNGTSDYVDMGYANYSFGHSITIGTRFKISELKTVEADIVDNYESAGFGLYILNGIPSFSIYTTDYKIVRASDAVDVNKWYTIVGTYDGTKMTLYINGVQVGTPLTFSNDDIKKSAVSMVIGGNRESNGSTASLFGGQISDVFLTKEVLDADTIAKNFSNGFNYTETDETYFYYKHN